MRALSLRQPFAWLTVHGGKYVENRTWATQYRGWFLVHASQQYTSKDVMLAQVLLGELGDQAPELASHKEWATGGIVGAALLVGVLDRIRPGYGIREPWRIEGQYGFALPERVALPFVPCSGLHRFWRVKPELKSALRPHVPDWLWDKLEEAEQRFGKGPKV